ncbi:peptidoglycan DD-metalloendopeptidase family protein [Oceanirhabdus seepicola]|uniref:M23 family metallopeptidase n=1 Tax=Oceanirhabdus seepicola TaxID=2828781 RepID=A0A9J6P2I4_9CLOT|nr:peptidoglycan DD-metalloendopeptidase family protein [Oceanirhabdus seepicola]MCM1990723.1 M23 family metallopeptidase [Oceanirhabdus seepicola]
MGNYNELYKNYYKQVSGVEERRQHDVYRDRADSKNYRRRYAAKRMSFVDKFIYQIIVVVIVVGIYILSPYFGEKVNATIRGNMNKYLVTWDMSDQVKNFSFKGFQESCIEKIDGVVNDITGGGAFSLIKEEFLLPINGKVLNADNMDSEKELIISSQYNGVVKSSYEGKIKKITSEEDGKMTVTIDHGRGVETVYGNLSGVYYKEKDFIETGEVIGSAAIDDNKKFAVVFKILYMGKEKNPAKYMTVNGI